MDTFNVDSGFKIHHCMETIAPRDDWLVRIGHTFINLNYLKNEDVWNRKISNNSHMYAGKLIFPASKEQERSINDIIEEDPIGKFNYFQTESLKCNILVPRMAVHLSPRSIEIICDRVFSKKNVNEEFVELIYKYFITIYLKRYYSWSSLHLLVKASKAYPIHFKTTVEIMMKDLEIPNNILQDYVETLDQNNCSNLMKFITELNLVKEEFNHNIPFLYLLYTKCRRNEDIFNYILSNLEQHGRFCAYNKSYGRFLLYVIQNVSGYSFQIKSLKRMIEKHCTPFKGPCMAALEKIVREIMELQMNFHEEPRIVIPRPVDNFEL